jgi:hypothetical protein
MRPAKGTKSRQRGRSSFPLHGLFAPIRTDAARRIPSTTDGADRTDSSEHQSLASVAAVPSVVYGSCQSSRVQLHPSAPAWERLLAKLRFATRVPLNRRRFPPATASMTGTRYRRVRSDPDAGGVRGADCSVGPRFRNRSGDRRAVRFPPGLHPWGRVRDSPKRATDLVMVEEQLSERFAIPPAPGEGPEL